MCDESFFKLFRYSTDIVTRFSKLWTSEHNEIQLKLHTEFFSLKVQKQIMLHYL